MRSRPIIAIDGPAGAGKSTCARLLATRLGLRYLDTGALYRAVTLAALRRGLSPADEGAVAVLAQTAQVVLVPGTPPRVLLDGEDVSHEIRGPAVTTAVSTVAALPRVRAEMVRHQRAFAAGGGVVAEGRDIGTVVFPDAELKVFLDADAQVRAGRRARERGDKDVAAVEREICERDRKDAEREIAPLRAAADAVVVDTTGLPVEDVVERIAALLGDLGELRGAG
jgi:cytidylate kinase